MKKRVLSIIVSLSLLVSLLSTVGFAASGTTRSVGVGQTYECVSQALADANDGDTIVLTGGDVLFLTRDEQTKGKPYVIEKAVTIQSAGNATLIVNATGLVLGADVTIQNLNLSYVAHTEINGIFANGHTLTISNMGDGNNNNHPVRVFAGGLYKDGAWLGTPGSHGTVRISGSSTVVGSVFACGLSAPGEVQSSWTIPCTVEITDKVTVNTSWTVPNVNDGKLYEVMGYFPSEKSNDGTQKYARSTYAAGEPARIILNQTATMTIDGDSGSATPGAAVSINPGQFPANPELYHVSHLTIGGGAVAPRTLNRGCDLTVPQGATLNLSDVMGAGTTFSVGNFSGGGILQIPNESTLAIGGAVTGRTEFRTVENAGEEYSGTVIGGHTYIQSPANTPDDAFVLANPHPTQLGMQLTKDAAGSWSAESAPPKADDISITGISLMDFTAPAAGDIFAYEFIPVYTTADGKQIEDYCFGVWYGGKQTDSNGETLDDTFLEGYPYRLELELTVPVGDVAYCFRPGVTLPEGFRLISAIPAAGSYRICIEKTFGASDPVDPDPIDPDPVDPDPVDPDPVDPDPVDPDPVDPDPVDPDPVDPDPVDPDPVDPDPVDPDPVDPDPVDPDPVDPDPVDPDPVDPDPVVNNFTDVKDTPSTNWYYQPVLWAVEQGITTGTSSTTFSPDNNCTRAQAVTFLWRAAGQPEPKTVDSPFTDVQDTNQYYYKAVLWSVEQGITTGATKTTFEPESICTRGQIVTFLWRYEDKPAAETTDQFADVSADSYYAGAIAWAVKQSVTNGTSATKFSPEDDCTRAHIVTFLYRDLA